MDYSGLSGCSWNRNKGRWPPGWPEDCLIEKLPLHKRCRGKETLNFREDRVLSQELDLGGQFYFPKSSSVTPLALFPFDPLRSCQGASLDSEAEHPGRWEGGARGFSLGCKAAL